MNKRAFVDLIIVGAIAITLLAGVATYILFSSEKQIDLKDYYIGDTANRIVYSSPCIDKVPVEHMAYFKTREQAEKLNFTYIRGCD